MNQVDQVICALQGLLDRRSRIGIAMNPLHRIIQIGMREFVGGSGQSSNSELFKQTIADCGSDEAGSTGNRYHSLGHDKLLYEDGLVGQTKI